MRVKDLVECPAARSSLASRRAYHGCVLRCDESMGQPQARTVRALRSTLAENNVVRPRTRAPLMPSTLVRAPAPSASDDARTTVLGHREIDDAVSN